ncbi:MAG: RNA polymerase sigma-70 factor [Cyclobacteriaceae bacterium]
MNAKTDFEAIFREYYPYLYNLSNKVLNDRSTAEDIVQSVFLSVWKKRVELKISTSWRSYLSRAVVNACYDYLKKSARMVSLNKVEADAVHTTEEAVAHAELQQNIKKAIARLPEKCRLIFTMSRFEGLSSAEIADNMNLSKKTVDNQIGIALTKLREELKPYITLKVIIILLLLLLLIG